MPDIHRVLRFVALLSVLAVPPVAAQDDVITLARADASAGQRGQALARLETHLVDSPRDVDARLTYGLILSWEGRYDEARTELQRVLEQTPDYEDARAALMNVEWWSGRAAAARDLARLILARNPGHAGARLMRQRLDAASQPWSVSTWYSMDAFNDQNAWHEVATSIGRELPRGTVLVRGTNARRFGYTDQLIEVEAYPSFRAGTYAFVGVGAATRQNLYPEYRLSFDLYQSVGGGVEVSGGLRRLQFTEGVSIYVGTLTKYVGPWSVGGKVYFVPSDTSDSWSFHTETRRYLGSEGLSFLSVGLSHGFNREEPRGLGDTIQVHSNTVRSQMDVFVSRQTRLLASASVSRQERALRSPLWQLTVSAGAAYRF